MSTDLRALLAAIVADPADDTARLVYADCLEEQGNLPRAKFIRLQIEAERLHPASSARARLEDQAQTLFAEHWINWWGEVCAGVGLPMPTREPGGLFGRMVRRVGIVKPPGHPYELLPFAVRSPPVWPYNPALAGWRHTTFQRGFPDSVRVSYLDMNTARNFLQRWPANAPLADLSVTAPYTEEWIDGPSLTGLRSLTLDDFDPVCLIGVLTSPHLGRLEELTLIVPVQGDLALTFGDELARGVTSPRVRQLKRLRVPVWSDRTTEVLASAANLAGLKALTVEMAPPAVDDDVMYGNEDLDAAGERLARLARSPYLAGLRELTVVGDLDAAGIEAVFRNPTWTGLRKLDFSLPDRSGDFDPLTGSDDLPELEELRLSGVSFSMAQIAAFARSPLLKRLRHFAVRGFPALAVDIEIANAVDPNRIETFAIGSRETPPRVASLLRARFGDRFRLVT